KEKASMVVFEATGGYESKLMNALNDSPIPMAMVNARQVRSFADAMNLVKTDKIDAEIIAKFAQVVNIKAQVKKDVNQKACDELISRRGQLIDMQTAEKNRLEHASKGILKEITAHISYLEKQIASIDKQLGEYIETNEVLKKNAKILKSVTGVGPVLTMTILSRLPEIGMLSSKEIAKLVGVAPINNDSGKMSKKRRTIGGRMDIKGVLYMATMSATQKNPVIREFYQKLVQSGKPKMVALVASMRKLIVILNSMIKHQTLWNPHTNNP
ncbi:MAG: IS110 family transposase, partial [Pedobacter sp.]